MRTDLVKIRLHCNKFYDSKKELTTILLSRLSVALMNLTVQH